MKYRYGNSSGSCGDSQYNKLLRLVHTSDFCSDPRPQRTLISNGPVHHWCASWLGVGAKIVRVYEALDLPVKRNIKQISRTNSILFRGTTYRQGIKSSSLR
ncbi:hypothetical protein GDO86_010824 [Hymenochirus boettgeri]|uniref:Uncharacterized protein n=1 Tax=Hymenochirus boettgeri TaxID=247094 RepID=A0A8T2JES7_9PIPI|nr:hypothetical protein GDO86_010824 [Hymenochirus boettgeri]